MHAFSTLSNLVVDGKLRIRVDSNLKHKTHSIVMALRRLLGFSDGELMRSDAKPCSRLMRQTAGIFSVGGALGFWVLCRLHYGMFCVFCWFFFFFT